MNSTHHIDIRTSPDSLWLWLTREDRISQWNVDIVSSDSGDVEPGVGAVSHVRIREGSKVIDYQSEVLVFDEPTHLRIQLTGGSLGAGPMDIDYRITPSPQGVQLTMTGHWQPHGLFLKLMSPIISLLGARNSRNALGRLKQLAEAS